MLPRHEDLIYVVGAPDAFSGRPVEAFSSEVRGFLARLSERLIDDPAAKALPDVVAFAWWCRKANVERQAARYGDGALRLGRGIAFHVTPTNMPVNFAFSWVFALLAGNANVVRLPNRDFAQIRVIVRHITELLSETAYADLAKMTAFVN
jgi:hypothetical protein